MMWSVQFIVKVLEKYFILKPFETCSRLNVWLKVIAHVVS